MKILILGGYGVFGGRLAQLLSDMPDMDILIAGRTADRAQAFCDSFTGTARAHPTVLDRTDIAAGLAVHTPDLVVDASGPFQNYGDDPYGVVKACIAAKINYMDLADSADFVFGIRAYDADARAAGVYTLSGVSSFPVLTSAVIRELSKTMQVTQITGGVAPSPFAGIGMNVMRAIVSYAGSPITLRRHGQDIQVAGLTESLRYTVAVPGRTPLHNIRFSLIEVPDLRVIPAAYPDLHSIWMGAGPVPESLHRILNLLAKARHRLRLPSYAPLAPLFHLILNRAKFGEHRGGMFVQATGIKDGKSHEVSWHLVAEGDDGPFIPSMAVNALIRKQLNGTAPQIGARAATDELTLADYDTSFASKSIYTGFRHPLPAHSPLYQTILGDAFDTLPAPIQQLHTLTDRAQWQGDVQVTAASNPIATVIARIFGFPTHTHATNVTVTLTKDATGELWQRQFGTAKFQSHQRLGTGRNAHLIVERFGPFDIGLAITISQGRLELTPRRWSIFGVPLPKFLLPKGTSYEHADDGQFHFNVIIAAPIIGRIVAYQGTLWPVTP